MKKQEKFQDQGLTPNNLSDVTSKHLLLAITIIKSSKSVKNARKTTSTKQSQSKNIFRNSMNIYLNNSIDYYLINILNWKKKKQKKKKKTCNQITHSMRYRIFIFKTLVHFKSSTKHSATLNSKQTLIFKIFKMFLK